MRYALLATVLPALLFAQESTPKDRQKYAKSLAKEGQAGITKLIPYMQDPDVDVRREVVQSIVAIGGAGSLEPLTTFLGDGDPAVQMHATDGLVNFYLPGYWQAGISGSVKRVGTKVLSRWTDTNDQVIPVYVEVRPEIVAAIGKLANASTTVDARANAVRAVGVLRGRTAVDDLTQALASKDSKIIYEVLVAFEKIRERSVAPKVHYLLRDLDEKVQLAAMETVGLLMNPESVEPLREAYDRGRNERVRRAALNALAQFPTEATRPLFTAQADSADEYMRAAAAEGLARMNGEGDREKLRTLFESETKMRPRLAQAFGAVRLGDHAMGEFDPLRYLVNTLNQKAWKGVAEGYLNELIRNEAIAAAIAPELPKATKAEKLSLSQVFSRGDKKQSEPALDALTRDADTEVANEALRAMRSLRAQNP